MQALASWSLIVDIHLSTVSVSVDDERIRDGYVAG